MATVAKADADIALMDSRKRVSISWSGGKDSAFALYKILLSQEYLVTGLHTVISKETKRVGLHGVREELINEQAKAIGLPLEKIYLEAAADHEEYTRCMKNFYRKSAKHIDSIIFGDIFLEDLKIYREQLLQESDITGIYPLWKIDSNLLVTDFINSGFKTAICSCNEELHTLNVLAKVLQEELIKSFPPHVDPCGERGEFHTFVFGGPIFKKPLEFTLGETVSKTYHYKKVTASGNTEDQISIFWFQDFLPRIPE